MRAEPRSVSAANMADWDPKVPNGFAAEHG
jgi:hypothetical protein